jgi:hypothetical protein
MRRTSWMWGHCYPLAAYDLANNLEWARSITTTKQAPRMAEAAEVLAMRLVSRVAIELL